MEINNLFDANDFSGVEREDFDCDDLQPLPEATCVECGIPNELFGDSAAILEFLYNFSDLIDFLPNNITFEALEEILTSQKICGLFGDVLYALLKTIFAFQEEENQLPVPKDVASSNESIEVKEALKAAKSMSMRIHQCYYSTLSNLSISPFTVTEILRLHILSSGAGEGSKLEREDACLLLNIDNPELVESLSRKTVFELSVADRLKILHTLINQISSFSKFRNYVEEAGEKHWELQRQLEELEENEKLEAMKQNRNRTNMSTRGAQNSAEASEIRLRMKGKIRYLKQQLRKLEGCYRLEPLGSDRWSRKYWLFNSLQGLFVENEGLTFSNCTLNCYSLKELALKTKCFVTLKDFNHYPLSDSSNYSDLSDDDSSTMSDDSNDSTTPLKTISKTKCLPPLTNTRKHILIHISKDGKNYCVPANADVYKNIEWSFYHTPAAIESLVSSLNDRGIRESKLKNVLQRKSNLLSESIKQCPRKYLNAKLVDTFESVKCHKKRNKRKNCFSRFKSMKFADYSPQNAIEATFKYQCLNEEEHLFDCRMCLIELREEWRNSLSKDEVLSLHECVQYLLILAESIFPQFLNNSFKKKDEKFLDWKGSLMNCGSYSQLFIHFNTLVTNIIWPKSASVSHCVICSQRSNHGKMLFCSGCNKSFHTYCTSTPSKQIPIGKWYCLSCTEPSTPISPRKEKQKDVKYLEDSSDENSSSDTTESSWNYSSTSLDASSDSSSDSSSTIEHEAEPENEVKCFACEKEEIEISCSKCGASFHNNCHSPSPVLSGEPQQLAATVNFVCFKCTGSDKTKEIEVKIEKTEKETRGKRKCLRLNEGYNEHTGASVKNSISSKKCAKMLTKLKNHRDTVHFWRKLTTEKVSNFNSVNGSVNLNDVASKLKSRAYKCDEQFILDVYLIFKNSLLHSSETSELYLASKRLSVFFKHLLSDYGFEGMKGLIEK